MMADEEKTEDPTPKKIQKAREEGNVPKSVETAGFIVLFLALLVLFFYVKYIIFYFEDFFKYFYSFIGIEITKNLVFNIIIKVAFYFFILMFPIFLVVIIAGIVANVSQFGFLFTTKVLKPKFEKLNPIKGLKNLFSLKKIVEGVKTTLKVFIAFLVGFEIFLSFFPQMPKLELMDFFNQIRWLESKIVLIVLSMLAVFFVFAVIDFVYQRYTYKKSLRMSKQEIKDEYKQSEGNPEVKAKIRRKMMEIMKQRMLAEVPKADVVITNPTHYAVALRYDKTKDEAPRVIAKGVDNMAIKIKEIAREAGVMIVENPPLARELYKLVEVDEIIPPKLYKAVAEILAYVYKAKLK
jgi:flagellar biosynthetic protein FlhB